MGPVAFLNAGIFWDVYPQQGLGQRRQSDLVHTDKAGCDGRVEEVPDPKSPLSIQAPYIVISTLKHVYHRLVCQHFAYWFHIIDCKRID